MFRRIAVRTCAALAVAALLLCLPGCAGSAGTPATPPASPALTTTVTAQPSGPTTLTPEAIDYARSLGGTTHKGEPVFLVLALTVQTQQEASAALAAMLPTFGDAQVYFTVQRSDTFAGLAPGRWVAAEAYWTKDEATQGLEWATGRGTEAAPLAPTLETVTVASDDPVPVVEDVMFDELSITPPSGPLVRVPDILNPTMSHHYPVDYRADPDGTTQAMRAYAHDLALRAGLLASVEFRSIALADEQSPRAGTMVPRGTIVRVRIGIGD